MSTNQLLRIFGARTIPVKKILPHAIAIDEFKDDAGREKYETIIVDVENREVLDVLLDIEIVVMDVSKSLKKVIQR